VEVLGDGYFRAQLVNGHRVFAHPGRQVRGQLGGLAVGGRVRLELSPFDLSKGRIIGVVETKPGEAGPMEIDLKV
jgi:translation initiation factor IF-1